MLAEVALCLFGVSICAREKRERTVAVSQPDKTQLGLHAHTKDANEAGALASLFSEYASI